MLIRATTVLVRTATVTEQTNNQRHPRCSYQSHDRSYQSRDREGAEEWRLFSITDRFPVAGDGWGLAMDGRWQVRS